jgi:hypothetical protein
MPTAACVVNLCLIATALQAGHTACARPMPDDSG